MFVRGGDNAIWHKWWGPGGWSAWHSLGGSWISGPAAISRFRGSTDLFAIGSDGAVWSIAYANGWQFWYSLGGVCTSDPEAVSAHADHLEVFCRATDNAVWHRWWGPGGWSGWESLGGS